MTPSKVLFSEEQILKRVEEIAIDIDRDYRESQLAVVGLLEDSFVFMADLIRKISAEMLCYFMKAEIEEHNSQVSKVKRIFYSPELAVRGKDVLLVGGVLDTGITLDYITKQISQASPKRLRICYLIDKPKARRISINADYVGFVVDLPNLSYVVGYGLGYENRYRNLGDLKILSV